MGSFHSELVIPPPRVCGAVTGIVWHRRCSFRVHNMLAVPAASGTRAVIHQSVSRLTCAPRCSFLGSGWLLVRALLQELIPLEMQNTVFIQHPILLEQYLMEGSYHKVLAARMEVPATEYSYFMDSLMVTVR